MPYADAAKRRAKANERSKARYARQKRLFPEETMAKNRARLLELTEEVNQRIANDPVYAEYIRKKRAEWARDARDRCPREVRRAKVRRRNLKLFGLTETDYEAMFAAQSGVCAICSCPETATNQFGICSLSIDHCHVTGAIRGLLCSKCNRALGLLGDRIDYLRAAISYLEKSR